MLPKVLPAFQLAAAADAAAHARLVGGGRPARLPAEATDAGQPGDTTARVPRHCLRTCNRQFEFQNVSSMDDK